MTHQFRRRQRRMYYYMQLSVLISKRLVSQASPAKGVGFQPINWIRKLTPFAGEACETSKQ